jgi:hypothetical protein
MVLLLVVLLSRGVPGNRGEAGGARARHGEYRGDRSESLFEDGQLKCV